MLMMSLMVVGNKSNRLKNIKLKISKNDNKENNKIH